MAEDDYTQEQRQAIWDIIKVLGMCPNCYRYNSLVKGPRGGIAMIIKCSECETKYNITPIRLAGAYPIT